MGTKKAASVSYNFRSSRPAIVQETSWEAAVNEERRKREEQEAAEALAKHAVEEQQRQRDAKDEEKKKAREEEEASLRLAVEQARSAIAKTMNVPRKSVHEQPEELEVPEVLADPLALPTLPMLPFVGLDPAVVPAAVGQVATGSLEGEASSGSWAGYEHSDTAVVDRAFDALFQNQTARSAAVAAAVGSAVQADAAAAVEAKPMLTTWGGNGTFQARQKKQWGMGTYKSIFK